MDHALRAAKLAEFIEIAGYDRADELIDAIFSDAVSAAICMNEGCDFACEMEPGRYADDCEECHTGTMKAASVLAGLL